MTRKYFFLLAYTASLLLGNISVAHNAGLQRDIDATKTESHQQQSTSVGSVLQGHNILIKTGNGLKTAAGTTTKIRGSQLLAKNKLTIDTGTLDIAAGKNTYQSDTDTKQISVSVQQTVYGSTAGGPSVDLSLNRSKSENENTNWTNSQLLADNINLTTTDDANLFGANVHANKTLIANIGGDLHLESKQNRYTASNKGLGISVSMSFEDQAPEGSEPQTALEQEKARIAKKNHNESFSGAMDNLGDFGDGSVSGGGFNISNGRSRSRQTVLTSLTSGGTADITVDGHTQVTGALIATQGNDGSDLGKLNLSTATLSFHDLSDSDYNSQRASGINVSDNSSQWTYNNASGYGKSKTLATLGKGSLTVRDTANSADLSRLNRNVQQTARDLYSVDRQQGNIDMKLDHRMLTVEGRKQIAEDFKRSAILAESVWELSKQSISLFGSSTDGETSLFGNIDTDQKYFTATKNFVNTEGNEENVRILQDGDATPEQKQQAYTSLANYISGELGIPLTKANVLVQQGFNLATPINDFGTRQEIKGSYDPVSGEFYVVDDNIITTGQAANVVGHEVSHHADAVNEDASVTKSVLYKGNREEYAHMMGDATEDYLNYNYTSSGYSALKAKNSQYKNSNLKSPLVVANINKFNQLDQSKLESYNEAGHYYTTYYTALRLGIPDDTARTLALYSQLPDEIGRLDAINNQVMSISQELFSYFASRSVLVVNTEESDYHRDVVHKGGHALTGEDPVHVRKAVKGLISELETPEEIGLLLHTLADTYAHNRLGDETEQYQTGVGHYWDDTSPDLIHKRKQLFNEYVGDLVGVLATKYKPGRSKASVVKLADNIKLDFDLALRHAVDRATYSQSQGGYVAEAKSMPTDIATPLGFNVLQVDDDKASSYIIEGFGLLPDRFRAEQNLAPEREGRPSMKALLIDRPELFEPGHTSWNSKAEDLKSFIERSSPVGYSATEKSLMYIDNIHEVETLADKISPWVMNRSIMNRVLPKKKKGKSAAP